jgi:hypothetical protein
VAARDVPHHRLRPALLREVAPALPGPRVHRARLLLRGSADPSGPDRRPRLLARGPRGSRRCRGLHGVLRHPGAPTRHHRRLEPVRRPAQRHARHVVRGRRLRRPLALGRQDRARRARRPARVGRAPELGAGRADHRLSGPAPGADPARLADAGGLPRRRLHPAPDHPRAGRRCRHRQRVPLPDRQHLRAHARGVTRQHADPRGGAVERAAQHSPPHPRAEQPRRGRRGHARDGLGRLQRLGLRPDVAHGERRRPLPAHRHRHDEGLGRGRPGRPGRPGDDHRAVRLPLQPHPDPAPAGQQDRALPRGDRQPAHPGRERRRPQRRPGRRRNVPARTRERVRLEGDGHQRRLHPARAGDQRLLVVAQDRVPRLRRLRRACRGRRRRRDDRGVPRARRPLRLHHGRSVRFEDLDPGVTLCVDTIDVGTPVPEGEGS